MPYDEEFTHFNYRLQGFGDIYVNAANMHDQNMIELIERLLDSGFTTNQITEHLEAHFKDKIKTL